MTRTELSRGQNLGCFENEYTFEENILGTRTMMKIEQTDCECHSSSKQTQRRAESVAFVLVCSSQKVMRLRVAVLVIDETMMIVEKCC
jgi:hypothetical protein